MAPPGCPEFAFSTIEAAKMRILLAALFINCLLFIVLLKTKNSYIVRYFTVNR